MGYFCDVAVAHFCCTEKSAIDQCMIYFFDQRYNICFPFFPLVDIWDEEQFLVRTFNDESNGFGELIPVWDKNGLYLERWADVFPVSFRQGVDENIVQCNQLTPGTIVFQKALHFGHGIYRHGLAVHGFTTQEHQSCIMPHVRMGKEDAIGCFYTGGWQQTIEDIGL